MKRLRIIYANERHVYLNEKWTVYSKLWKRRNSRSHQSDSYSLSLYIYPRGDFTCSLHRVERCYVARCAKNWLPVTGNLDYNACGYPPNPWIINQSERFRRALPHPFVLGNYIIDFHFRACCSPIFIPFLMSDYFIFYGCCDIRIIVLCICFDWMLIFGWKSKLVKIIEITIKFHRNHWLKLLFYHDWLLRLISIFENRIRYNYIRNNSDDNRINGKN